jgi:hypothetical protein
MPFDLAATRKELHIGGVWLPAADDSRIDVIDPATEQTIASVADAGVEDALAAVDAAARAGLHARRASGGKSCVAPLSSCSSRQKRLRD